LLKPLLWEHRPRHGEKRDDHTSVQEIAAAQFSTHQRLRSHVPDTDLHQNDGYGYPDGRSIDGAEMEGRRRHHRCCGVELVDQSSAEDRRSDDRDRQGELIQPLMDTSPVTVQLVVYVGAAVAVAVGIVLWVSREFAKRDKSLADHKLHAAETYATKAGLKESLDRVHDALDRLADRIDTLIRGDRSIQPRRRGDDT